MPQGKIAAQCGHAFLDTFLKATEVTPLKASQYRGPSHGTKVVLKAKNIDSLIRAYDESIACGIPCALIEDNGHICPPDFDGETPVVTALGIGPATRKEINHITKRFNAF